MSSSSSNEMKQEEQQQQQQERPKKKNEGRNCRHSCGCRKTKNQAVFLHVRIRGTLTTHEDNNRLHPFCTSSCNFKINGPIRRNRYSSASDAGDTEETTALSSLSTTLLLPRKRKITKKKRNSSASAEVRGIDMWNNLVQTSVQQYIERMNHQEQEQQEQNQQIQQSSNI